MKTKEVWIVYNEKGFVGIFSSENKAEKSTADYIVKTAIPPRMDDEIKKDILEAYNDGDYTSVIDLWNIWSVDTEQNDEFAIFNREMDGDISC